MQSMKMSVFFVMGKWFDSGVLNWKTSFQTTIAAEIYQSIKRINRLNRDTAEVYLINHDTEIINLVISQFQNIKVQEYQLEKEIKYKETKMDKYNQRRKRRLLRYGIYRTIVHLQRKIQKSWLREQIGHRNHNTFARDVLNQIEVAGWRQTI